MTYIAREDPIAAEDSSVSAASALQALVAAGSREFVLLGRPNPLARLIGDTEKPGALPVRFARATMTRQALRRKAERQKRFRSGVPGLLAALTR